MAWTGFTYQIGLEGGSFTDLDDYCDNVRIASESDAPKRGGNVEIPYADGEFTDPFKFRRPGTIMLDCMVSYTNDLGTVTHADGAAGHVFENLSALKALFAGDGLSRVVLRRTAPDQGTMEARVEFMGGVRASGPRMRYIFPLRMIDGYWREQTLSTDTESSISSFPHAYTIATGGNYPIGDPKITFTCVTDGVSPSLTQTVLAETIQATGSFVAADEIIIDLGRDRAFTKNGTRYGLISGNRAWWMRLTPAQALLGMTLGDGTTTGTWTCKIEWRNKWL